MAKGGDVGAMKGNYRGKGASVVYKDLGLNSLLKRVSDLGFTHVRVGIVGPKAGDKSGDGRLTVAEVAMIHILGLAPSHHIRRDFIGAPFHSPEGKKRMEVFFGVAAQHVLKYDRDPEIAMIKIGQAAVAIIRGGHAFNTDPSKGASRAVGVRPLAQSTIEKKRNLANTDHRYRQYEDVYSSVGSRKLYSRRSDSPGNVLNETGNLLAAVSYRVVRTSGSMVDAGAIGADGGMRSVDSYTVDFGDDV